MSLLGRLVGQEKRDSTFARPDEWLVDALTGGTTYAGKAVSVQSSMALVPVYSSVSLLAGAIGSLPLVVYRRLDNGRERAHNHRTWKLVHDQPNSEMGADEMWEMVGGHLNLWGNAFIAKMRDSLGNVGELWPLRPSRVQVGRNSDGSRYFLLDGEKRYGEQDILHIRGLGIEDGLVGLSPIQQARQMLAGSMALEEFSGTFWANSANPGGVLRHPNKLSEDAAKRLKASWKAHHGGPSKAGEVAVLEEDMKWESTGMPLDDAQFIETAKFSDLRVAQLFRIPPRMLGAQQGDSMTYSNTELEGIDFVRWSLRRWLVRIERSLLRDPSLFVQGTRIYPEFLVDGLLRADTKTRYEAYKLALDPATGWMNKDEVRELENLNPLPEEEESAPPEPEPRMNGKGTHLVRY